MSITIDDKTVDIFKIFDELTQTYSKEIDGYISLTKAVEAMINQKEKDIQGIKDKTIALLKQSIKYPEITVSEKTALIVEYGKVDHADGETENLEPLVTVSPPVKERKSGLRKQKKEAKTRKGKVSLKDLAVWKAVTEPKAPRIKKTEKPAQGKNNLKCLHHPEAPVADIHRQLCSSCRWKLKAYGLMENYNDPAVVSYLKGETKSAPNVGQSMCPNHPDRPSYSKKTGLCQYCQSKARAIGVADRHLTEEELELIRNPLM